MKECLDTLMQLRSDVNGAVSEVEEAADDSGVKTAILNILDGVYEDLDDAISIITSGTVVSK